MARHLGADLVFLGALASFSGPAWAAVVPCPNREIDAAPAIEAALNGAGEGETVYLEAGTYYFARPVWVRTAFKGSLRGAGKDRTLLTVLPGAKIPGIPVSQFLGERRPLSLSTFFYFEVPRGEAARIAVSDFSIVVTDPEPAGPQDLNRTWWHGALYNLFVVTASQADATFERLRLKGSAGRFSSGSWNLAHAFHIYGYYPDYYLAGNLSVIDCDFENMACGYNPFSIRDGTETVRNNTFRNVGFAVYIEDHSNCTVTVSGNEMLDVKWIGVTAHQGSMNTPTQPSTFLITDNDVHGVEWADGILFWDYPAYVTTENPNPPPRPLEKTLIGVASNNRVTLNSVFGGIGGDSARDVVVTNNQIRGSGFSGIYCLACSGWTIHGNNVSDFDAMPTEFFPGLPAAPIALYWSDHCQVVGGANKTNSLDYGGADNTFVGVDNAEYTDLGQDVRSAMQRKRDVIRSMPRH